MDHASMPDTGMTPQEGTAYLRSGDCAGNDQELVQVTGRSRRKHIRLWLVGNVCVQRSLGTGSGLSLYCDRQNTSLLCSLTNTSEEESSAA
jgi:hypothetical protein